MDDDKVFLKSLYKTEKSRRNYKEMITVREQSIENKVNFNRKWIRLYPPGWPEKPNLGKNHRNPDNSKPGFLVTLNWVRDPSSVRGLCQHKLHIMWMMNHLNLKSKFKTLNNRWAMNKSNNFGISSATIRERTVWRIRFFAVPYLFFFLRASFEWKFPGLCLFGWYGGRLLLLYVYLGLSKIQIFTFNKLIISELILLAT